MKEITKNALPLCFAALYARMSEKAAEFGYALALHGSLSRDCDMIAVPWTHEAVSAETLLDSFMGIVGGFFAPQDYVAYKPHGRRAWSIHLGGGPYLDISVMPRVDANGKIMLQSMEVERKFWDLHVLKTEVA